MKPVGLHTDFTDDLPKFCQRYEKILELNGIPSKRVFCGSPEFWRMLPELSAFIYRWEHYSQYHQLAQTLMPLIEREFKVPLFPNYDTAWHFDDKIRQYYLMQTHNEPMTPCWIFWNHREASEFAVSAQYPLVFKLKGGAGSTNVVLLQNAGEAQRLIDAMFGPGIQPGRIPLADGLQSKFFSLEKRLRTWGGGLARRHSHHPPLMWSREYGYALFQKFLPNNDGDTRVTVVGERAFAFRRMNRPGDFRSSGSGRIDHDPSKIEMRFVEEAFRISRKFKFQTMAYDFLVNESGRPEFVEMCYTFNDDAIYKCEGYWDGELKWHDGHYYPQYFQLMDLLGRPDLKSPGGPL